MVVEARSCLLLLCTEHVHCAMSSVFAVTRLFLPGEPQNSSPLTVMPQGDSSSHQLIMQTDVREK
jgi:hypothetical protein